MSEAGQQEALDLMEPKELEPGIWLGMDEEAYRSDPAVAVSDLKQFLSPRRMTGRHLIVGSVLHAVILEPDIAKDKYITTPEEWKLNTKAGKAALELFEEENPGKIAVRPSEREQVSKLYKAIKGCGAAMKIIEASGENELTLAAELHPGVLSKGRLDIRRKTLIADIKTTSATDREDFLDHVYKYGYNSSHAYYHDLYEKLAEPLPFVWICASKTTEQAWVTMAPGQSYHSGRYWYQSALNIYSRARKAGVIL